MRGIKSFMTAQFLLARTAQRKVGCVRLKSSSLKVYVVSGLSSKILLLGWSNGIKKTYPPDVVVHNLPRRQKCLWCHHHSTSLIKIGTSKDEFMRKSLRSSPIAARNHSTSSENHT